MKKFVPLTRGELLELPASVDLVTAGHALNLGRTKSHELARSGQFPVPVLRLGKEYRVRAADLLAFLGINPKSEPGGAPIGGDVA